MLAALVTVFFWAPPLTTVIIDLAREAASALPLMAERLARTDQRGEACVRISTSAARR